MKDETFVGLFKEAKDKKISIGKLINQILDEHVANYKASSEIELVGTGEGRPLGSKVGEVGVKSMKDMKQ